MADQLTVYFTSDTHGFLYPTDFISPGVLAQGLLRMSFPKDGNTLILDGGDTLQGSPLTYYCQTKGLPMPCAAVMNDLAYDYITIGNHDLNYGYETLQAYLAASNAVCLCANLTDTEGKLPILPYTVHTLDNGLRVGIIGIVTHWVTVWEQPETLRQFRVTDTLQAAKAAVEALRDKVDLLIGLYHGGFERNVETGLPESTTDENIGWTLCETLPFDILLTGHQHIPMAGREIHGTHVAQTPGNAKGYIRLTVNTQGTISSQLCTPDAPPAIKPWEQALFSDLNAWLDTPIGRLSRSLKPEAKLQMALHGSPIADFINRVQLDASGAQISCTALSNDAAGFNAEVTVRDVVASYPFANTLVVLQVTGQVLRDALEQCATYFTVADNGEVTIGDAFLKPKEAHYNFDYFAGITYTFDLRISFGSRVADLRYQGKPVQAEDSFTLVMNNYRATGAGGFACYTSCKRESEIQTEVSELILDYLGSHDRISVPDTSGYTVILPDGSTA